MELKYRNNFLFAFGLMFFLLGPRFITIFIRYDITLFEILVSFFLMILGIILMCGAVLPYEQRASRLKQDGECYEAEITDILYSYWSGSLTLECVYTNRDGKRCIVSTVNLRPAKRRISYNVISSFTAKVWVNPDNPKDYYVGVMYNGDKSDGRTQFDNDYR